MLCDGYAIPATTQTDAHDAIVVNGANENNLQNVSLEIPKRRLTAFAGVSGSGKSSLVFDTIAAESQRLINETYSSFVQGFMPSMARPDVVGLSGVTAAIVVDQSALGSNVRSTVGTATDVTPMLRVLFCCACCFPASPSRPRAGRARIPSTCPASPAGARSQTRRARKLW
ncbi:hypothetical protein GC584_08570 [Corynebacterium sp. zg912]|uniref:UvrABC system protein A n=1 Tax=Corynebacterium wankanglinii TaxID=2735136 RepID=A0A7V8UVE3_9CORY|nr:hypothetical protein [Corynebacterium wankanglinii]MCR5929461.1 hypothetical protein [Corynebacterium sp. zg912]